MIKTTEFWIFGIIQSMSLGIIMFLIFHSLSTIKGDNIIGLDTSLILSIIFPLFLLFTEYIIYSKDKL